MSLTGALAACCHLNWRTRTRLVGQYCGSRGSPGWTSRLDGLSTIIGYGVAALPHRYLTVFTLFIPLPYVVPATIRGYFLHLTRLYFLPDDCGTHGCWQALLFACLPSLPTPLYNRFPSYAHAHARLCTRIRAAHAGTTPYLPAPRTPHNAAAPRSSHCTYAFLCHFPVLLPMYMDA